MPPVTENSSTSASLAYSLVDAPMLRRLTEEHALMRKALEFYATGDPDNPADGFVARDVLKKLHGVKKPNAQPTDKE